MHVFSQIKERKHIEQNFYYVARIMPQGWDLGGAGGVKNFSVGICHGAPSTAGSSSCCILVHLYFVKSKSSQMRELSSVIFKPQR